MYVEVPVPLPESLVYFPCDALSAGRTLDSLAIGYVKNTYCIGEYKEVLKGINSYNEFIMKQRFYLME